jgi:hypothetical protein
VWVGWRCEGVGGCVSVWLGVIACDCV